MPGFVIGGSGANGAAEVPPEVRRRHRWIFRSFGSGGPSDEVLLLLHSATRPTFELAEAVLHHDQEEVYFAGKQTWNEIEMSFYDAEQSPDSSAELWRWVNIVSNINDGVTVDQAGNYKKLGNLEMIDGQGETTETWKLYNCWPRVTNWGELNYDSSDLAEISVTMRYDRAVRE